MTMDREEELREKKLDMSGKVGVSQCHPSVLPTSPSCESELSALTTNVEPAKLEFTVICFV